MLFTLSILVASLVLTSAENICTQSCRRWGETTDCGSSCPPCRTKSTSDAFRFDCWDYLPYSNTCPLWSGIIDCSSGSPVPDIDLTSNKPVTLTIFNKCSSDYIVYYNGKAVSDQCLNGNYCSDYYGTNPAFYVKKSTDDPQLGFTLRIFLATDYSNLNIINIHYSTMGLAYNKNECMYADGKTCYIQIMKFFTSGPMAPSDIINNRRSDPEIYDVLELLRKVYQCDYDPYSEDSDAELWDHILDVTNINLKLTDADLTMFFDIYEGKMIIDLLMRESPLVAIRNIDLVEICKKNCVDPVVDPISYDNWRRLRSHMFDNFNINIDSDRITGNISLYLCNSGINLVF